MKDEENKEKKSRSSKDVLCPFPLHFFFSFIIHPSAFILGIYYAQHTQQWTHH